MSFHSPLILLLVPLAVFLVIYADRKNVPAGVRFSNVEFFNSLKSSLKLRLSRAMFIVRAVWLCLIIIALARPQSAIHDTTVRTEGIDIVLAIDCSTSMLAEDFKQGNRRMNRLDAVKEVVRDFINGRGGDRIGITAFAARAYTVSPLTLDYNWLIDNLDRIKTGIIEDGTAVGSGIAASLDRLKDTKAKSKIVILLTDGRNNAGKVSPLTAADIAKALKVKVYTIGAGTKGLAPYPAKDFFGRDTYQMRQVDIDEDTLTKIAEITGGKYYRATDAQSLAQIYKQIDKLEKTPMEEKGYTQYNELFVYFLIAGLVLLFLEIVLSNTVLRRIP